VVTSAKNYLDTALAAAPEAAALADDEAVAWIMYTSSDWGTSYSVGDVYTPGSKTVGTVATDVPVTGEGTYTVALDFTGTAAGYANGITFSAVAVGNGETLFPGYIMHITEVKINGEAVTMSGLPYTTSDDGICTRVNLYNAWVTAPPADAGCMMGSTRNCSPCPVDQNLFGQVKTLEVTFRYIKK
jgi:endoglucanase